MADITMMHCVDCSFDSRPEEVVDGKCLFCQSANFETLTGDAALESLQGYVNDSDSRGDAWEALSDAEREALTAYDAQFAEAMEHEVALNDRHRYGA